MTRHARLGQKKEIQESCFRQLLLERQPEEELRSPSLIIQIDRFAFNTAATNDNGSSIEADVVDAGTGVLLRPALCQPAMKRQAFERSCAFHEKLVVCVEMFSSPPS